MPPTPPTLTVQEVAERIGLGIRVKGAQQRQVTGCYVSDLLSDVMAHSNEGELWVTLQTHPNTVAVAAIKGIAALIIPNGRQPDPETARKAEAENLPILTTQLTTFGVAGRLYELLQGGARAEGG